ncbi:MAG: VOC family protein [Candidatus Marinimicrobia bacterium]|nr:VOC family protein [Candidatus Neomarinimicrobiota bacterium]
MNKSFVSIAVNSLEISVSFYVTILNFHTEKNIEPADGIRITFLSNTDNFTLELIERADLPAADNKGSSVSLMFSNNDLEEKRKILRYNDIEYLDDILPNGMKYLHFRDPDGVGIVLYE